MPDFTEWRDWPIFDNSLGAWLVAAAVAAGALAILLLARAGVRRYYQRLARTPGTEVLEIPLAVLRRTSLLLFIPLSLYIGLQPLKTGAAVDRVADSMVTISLFWQAGIWAVAAATTWLERKRQHSLETNRAAAGSIGIIGFIVSTLIWALVVLLTLDNLGVNITALVAGLGIGGIAVALAVQNVLGDLFASLSIALDKPFVIGDFLIIDDLMGSVEYIGIKSTRLRSLSGEQIIISNSDLLKSRVRNYGRMSQRRVEFLTWIAFDTPVDLIEKVPSILEQAVREQPQTKFDRAHFKRHGEWSLEFETVYIVLSADMNKFMDIQQAINLRIHRELERLGIEFAMSNRTLWTQGPRRDAANEPTQNSPRARLS